VTTSRVPARPQGVSGMGSVRRRGRAWQADARVNASESAGPSAPGPRPTPSSRSTSSRRSAAMGSPWGDSCGSGSPPGRPAPGSGTCGSTGSSAPPPGGRSWTRT